MIANLSWKKCPAQEFYELLENGIPVGTVGFHAGCWRGMLGGVTSSTHRAPHFDSLDEALANVMQQGEEKLVAMLSDDARRVLHQAGLL